MESGNVCSALTPIPNCFMEVTNQNLWNNIWAVATATCFLRKRKARIPMVELLIHSLLEQHTSLVNELAPKSSEILLHVLRYTVIA